MSFAPPDPHNAVPCPFFRCWIGPCGQTDRTKCKHSREYVFHKDVPKGEPYGYVGKPKDARCRCGKPAISECESAGSLVCGAYICHIGMCSAHGGTCV